MNEMINGKETKGQDLCFDICKNSSSESDQPYHRNVDEKGQNFTKLNPYPESETLSQLLGPIEP